MNINARSHADVGKMSCVNWKHLPENLQIVTNGYQFLEIIRKSTVVRI